MNQVTRAIPADELARVEARQEKTLAEAAVEKPRFVTKGGGAFEEVIDLDHPLEYAGVLYEKVTIRRPIMREWRAYLRACEDAVKANGPHADDLVDMPWVSAPAIVLEAMDFVDASRVEAAQERFFGRSSSLQEAATETPSEQTSTHGEPSL